MDPPESTAAGSGPTVDVPGGFGQWVFMLFTTFFRARTPEGLVTGNPGDILINSPDYPQWHQGVGGPFHNYWVHFDGPAADSLSAYRIPVNLPVRTISPLRCVPTLVTLQREHNFKEPFWEEAVDALLCAVFREIGRQLRLSQRIHISEHDQTHLEAFHDLRVRLWQTVGHSWSVDEMSAAVALSESRFLHLYRKFFGVSPVDDLIAARLERAKGLLAGSGATISEIADRCGFSDLYYFSRTFRKRVGATPTEYRSTR